MEPLKKDFDVYKIKTGKIVGVLETFWDNGGAVLRAVIGYGRIADKMIEEYADNGMIEGFYLFPRGQK